jgi:hypothetical protein
MTRLFGIAAIFFSPCLAWSQTNNATPSDAGSTPPAVASPATVSSSGTSQSPIGGLPEVPARPPMGTAIDDMVPLKPGQPTDAGPSAAVQATPVPTHVNPPPPRPPLGTPERPVGGADSSAPTSSGPRRPPFSVPSPPRPPLSTLR